ncbi:Tar ligand binding domain-containing protein [Roseomonas sp. PWR1]|uniref:Tar ligand binding domain-containing protein n=1 Tax=Roseomonas nitratireducens TaxID=2820810 RepID=A0ABS4AWJ8_9PROT|nr:methyl-accepting chemotaxis protein [Neoroseomonas nitratireducens]MBP0464952.1 Tar ligand binding domain-containing protein [Neoroseomonas nitratireducens]
MRVNGPVTTEEVTFDAEEVLVSRTDTGGRIVFSNAAFARVSGFSAEELQGAPHNVVRHPDMPKEAFADLWATIKAGRPWEGLVKNRTRAGAFYWVRANVTPVRDGDTVTGYISIRSRPEEAEKAQAEEAYRAIREGRARDIGLDDGQIVRRGWRARLATWRDSVAVRIAAALVLVTLAVVGVGAMTLGGMADSNDSLRRVYQERTVPLARLTEALDRMRDNATQLALLPIDIRGGHDTAERIAKVRDYVGRAEAAWNAYAAIPRVGDETAAAAAFLAAREAYLRDGLRPALALAEAGQAEALDRHLRDRAAPLFTPVMGALRRVIAHQTQAAEAAYAEAQEDFSDHAQGALVIGLFAVLLGGLCAWLAIRALRRPIRDLENHFVAIAANAFDRRIGTPAAREFREVTTQLRMLRARLAFAEAERGERERQAGEERRRIIGALAERVETEARLAVENVATRTGSIAGQTQAMAGIATDLSARASAMSATSGEARDAVEAVAAAAEELAASIREIASQAQRTGEITRRAVDGGASAEAAIGRLNATVSRIGEVLGLIRSIAGQTNLLALNATIEAARAGDAGKGFAVVAGEVKGLAGQTARSTEDIARQIAEIEEGTSAAVEAVAGIGGMIAEISEAAQAIASAMEQQAAVTQEIARNVAQSGLAVRRMSDAADSVSAAAEEAGQHAAGVSAATAAVDGDVAALRGTLVAVVRTSIEEADRRMSERISVSEPCAVIGGMGERDGRLVNVSSHGALVSGIAGLREEESVTLVLPRHGGLRVAAVVRGLSPAGVHLSLAPEDASGEAWRAALATMSASRRRAAA